MRPTTWLALTLAVVLACAGCADPSLEQEADDLRGAVAALPGVDSVDLDYTEPVTLDSGKVVLEVTMGEGASADQVVAVAETAYGAFSTTHQHEEADLAVHSGATSVALRSFEPTASVAAVGGAVRTGLGAAPEAGSVAVDLTTQEVPGGDHVAGTYVVALAPGSTAADVPAFLDSIAATHATSRLIGWGAAAADGTSLSYDRGLPPPELVEQWERLQASGPPLTVRGVASGAVFATGRLTTAYDVHDSADRHALDEITHPQLRALGDGAWTYELQGPSGAVLASIDRFVCAPMSEGPYDDELEAWVNARLGPCSAG